MVAKRGKSCPVVFFLSDFGGPRETTLGYTNVSVPCSHRIVNDNIASASSDNIDPDEPIGRAESSAACRATTFWQRRPIRVEPNCQTNVAPVSPPKLRHILSARRIVHGIHRRARILRLREDRRAPLRQPPEPPPRELCRSWGPTELGCPHRGPPSLRRTSLTNVRPERARAQVVSIVCRSIGNYLRRAAEVGESGARALRRGVSCLLPRSVATGRAGPRLRAPRACVWRGSRGAHEDDKDEPIDFSTDAWRSPMYRDPLEALEPTRHLGIRSVESRHHTEVTFLNATKGKARLFWLNYWGEEIRYKTLAPGQMHTQQTFETHPWTFATVSDDEDDDDDAEGVTRRRRLVTDGGAAVFWPTRSEEEIAADDDVDGGRVALRRRRERLRREGVPPDPGRVCAIREPTSTPWTREAHATKFPLFSGSPAGSSCSRTRDSATRTGRHRRLVPTGGGYRAATRTFATRSDFASVEADRALRWSSGPPGRRTRTTPAVTPRGRRAGDDPRRPSRGRRRVHHRASRSDRTRVRGRSNFLGDAGGNGVAGARAGVWLMSR